MVCSYSARARHISLDSMEAKVRRFIYSHNDLSVRQLESLALKEGFAKPWQVNMIYRRMIQEKVIWGHTPKREVQKQEFPMTETEGPMGQAIINSSQGIIVGMNKKTHRPIIITGNEAAIWREVAADVSATSNQIVSRLERKGKIVSQIDVHDVRVRMRRFGVELPDLRHANRRQVYLKPTEADFYVVPANEAVSLCSNGKVSLLIGSVEFRTRRMLWHHPKALPSEIVALLAKEDGLTTTPHSVRTIACNMRREGVALPKLINACHNAAGPHTVLDSKEAAIRKFFYERPYLNATDAVNALGGGIHEAYASLIHAKMISEGFDLYSRKGSYPHSDLNSFRSKICRVLYYNRGLESSEIVSILKREEGVDVAAHTVDMVRCRLRKMLREYGEVFPLLTGHKINRFSPLGSKTT